MAMERFLTALVFCEAPLDGYGTSALTTSAINKLVSGGGGGASTKPAAATRADAAEKGQQELDGKATAQRQRRAGFELAFDGLNCFETVVMH